MKKFSLIKNNIREFSDKQNISIRNIYVNTGISDGTLSNNSGLSEDNILKFLSYYTEINPIWLLTGKGEMLLKDNSKKEERNSGIQLCDLKTDHSIPSQEIPLYNIEASAGIVEFFKDSSNSEIIDTIKIPNLPKSDGAVFITGDSMYPLLKSGDIIIYKKITNIANNIFWGEMYLISIWTDDEEYIMVKYIQKSEEGKEYIKLVSQNKHHQDKNVHLSKVKALAIIKASVRINAMS